MINQYQQDIVEKDSELTKTQDTLFELEKKFGAAQEQWKAEKDRLNAEIKQQNMRWSLGLGIAGLWFDCCFIISVLYYICLIVFRLKDLDDTNKFLESARVELASRDLNLEEKLNVLKEDRDRLTQETIKLQSDLEIEKHEKVTLDQNLQRKTEEYETVIEQLKGNWEEATEKLTKLKQQFQVKLKSLKDQLNTSQVRFSFTNF
jgi:hypothetical protein